MLAWESLYTVQVGGLAVAVSNLAEELARAGHEVHYFTRRAPGQPGYMEINGVHYETFPSDPGLGTYAFAHSLSMSIVDGLHQVERHVGEFDIVHGHDWLMIDALHALKNEGRPVVLTYHSTEYGRNGGAFGSWPEFAQISAVERRGGAIADRVTTVSRCMKEELNFLYGISPGKIDVIPNGIDPLKFRLKLDPGATKQRYGLHPLAPVVMFIGRLEHQKGPDILVEAIPKVLANRWDARFIFSGRGSMRSYLERRAGELGVAHAAKFLDFLPHRDFIELLNSSDIVCLPSRNEPFGIALLEAWAAERPVVAADVGGFGENIEDSVDGIKVLPNPDSVARGINYLLDSPELMRKISQGGARKVRQFSWEKAVSKLIGTYSAVLHG